MRRIAFYDAKPYDKIWFDKLNEGRYEIVYFESRLSPKTAKLAEGFDCVCAFVNDEINAEVIDKLYDMEIRLLAMRSAGYNNVDIQAAYGKISIVRVPAYSPYAVAEHTMALILALNRKIHKAYLRTREFNFTLNGLTGFDLHNKTAGIIGTGKIGKIFIGICKGFGMKVLAYDAYPDANLDVEYVDLNTLLKNSDIISLHCPLVETTRHIIDKNALEQVKKGVLIANTSRGALIDSNALLQAIDNGIVGGAALDVYEEEADVFFQDNSDKIIKDDVLALLLSKPNVLITSHQAFLTDEALSNIAECTLSNIDDFFGGRFMPNEICYLCNADKAKGGCLKARNKRCF